MKMDKYYSSNADYYLALYFINCAARKTLYFASCKKLDLSSRYAMEFLGILRIHQEFLQNYVVFIFAEIFVDREETHISSNG